MNIFDIAVTMVLAFCLIRGYFKGLIGEISGIIGVIAGFYGAATYYPMMSEMLAKWIDMQGLRQVLSFFIIFCLILVAVSLISIGLQKILKLAFLGWVDRTFGLLFGAAKGVLIVSVILVMITSFGPKNPKFLSESTLTPYVVRVSSALSVLVSKENRKDLLTRLKSFV